MADIERLESYLGALSGAVLGYSGGVDSAVLAVVGARVLGPSRFVAVIGRSASYPEVQWRTAVDLAARFQVPLLEVHTSELADPDYIANPLNRCFFCKSELWRVLGAVAADRGFELLLDGTNADDLTEHRPGAAAGAARRVHSPFVELGWTKADVRDAALQLGLPTWDAPAAPCLSSRIQYGLPVTAERLRQVEHAEAVIRECGVVGDLRVRHLGDRARVEVLATERPLVEARWVEVADRLRALGFADAELDARGYRRGSLLPIAPASEGA
ncbi:MAG: ATP-dependent sacrificial sulfur transferase LarE [Gemmatimonadales bacterium]|nr:MAG: ATP-dependent sacrificial sulfur transferase LarE [Gemmatimonadales bacterium]